jgi:pyrimidine-nucleoside phosphorylase
MQPYDLIFNKRNGGTLQPEEIEALIAGYTQGEGVTDYQMAALLMAIYFRGMNEDELGHWTRAMLHSGVVLEHPEIAGAKIDKHSTGGVGDKVSLSLAPLVAAAGVYVPMISGRGLGHTGGTLDKLESIPGFRTDLPIERFKAQVAELGCAIIGQTGEIAPADKKLYALRDVTATVDCIPLIASSIMSKKLAEGLDGLVLDVKTGRGAFMTELDQARQLAETLIAIGRATGVETVARITAMDQPLGRAVGNALEVVEAIETLRGKGPDDFLDVVLTLSAEMLRLAGVERDHQAALELLQGLIDSGAAFGKLREMVSAQGGDESVLDDLERLPRAKESFDVLAPESGFIHVLDALVVGRTARMLGAGRKAITDAIDPVAGLVLERKRGDGVDKGDRIAILYARDHSLFEPAAHRFLSGLVIGEAPIGEQPLLIDRIA